jgi:hypothetical protein
MSNPTGAVLQDCKVSYARSGKTTNGTAVVSGILQQRYDTGGFQASQSFECYGEAKETLLKAATKIADAALAAEQVGPSAIHADNPSYSEPPANITVNVSGYFKTRKPTDTRKEWKTVFIIETVQIVEAH